MSKLTAARFDHLLVEAVVSDTNPLLGKSIRDGRFRTRYDAAVIAVYRNGERLAGKIGDIVLRTGDTLLLHVRRVLPRVIGTIVTSSSCLRSMNRDRCATTRH